MKVDIIQIGNSKGIRIPSVLMKECGFKDQAEVLVKDHSLVITPLKKPRQYWAKAFEKMGQCGDDALLMPEGPASSWDEEEWEW